jgi:hypothetical protein
MFKIEEFTICLHCGSSRDVVNAQIQSLNPLQEKYKVYWNNRIDRHPEIYESYSELINHSVATSPTEWVILINDRTSPSVEEVEKMISLLENGISCVLLYNVGFMGFSKELIRKIGWWDQRFTNGGWEDRDWVYRLKKSNLAIYESLEGTYDMSWKSPLNIPGAILSGKFWGEKWNNNYSDVAIQLLSEEDYPQWEKTLGEPKEEISSSWMTWDDSQLSIMYNQQDRPGSGPSGSSMIAGKSIILKL